MDDTVRENKQEQAITMLKMKQVEINRLPKKGDFEPYEISFIKSMLGPWPRALETAGLKPISKHYLEKRHRTINEKMRKRRRNMTSYTFTF